LFSRAVLEAAKQIGVPDIFHVHDWQTSMMPVFLHTVYSADPAFRTVGTVLTVHNAGYQGRFPPQTTEWLLLPWEIFTMDRVEHYNTFNFLKGGIVYSAGETCCMPSARNTSRMMLRCLGLSRALPRRRDSI
jgi:starch synthase